MGPQEVLPTGAGLVLEHVQLCGEEVHLFVHPSAPAACCPACGIWSGAFHSSYARNVADLPIADRQLTVHLRVRRFRCHEPARPLLSRCWRWWSGMVGVHADCAPIWSSSGSHSAAGPEVASADAR